LPIKTIVTANLPLDDSCARKQKARSCTLGKKAINVRGGKSVKKGEKRKKRKRAASVELTLKLAIKVGCLQRQPSTPFHNFI
jgi:hypothetical protein